MELMQNLMWLFTVPVLKVAIKVGVALSTLFLIVQVIRWALKSKARNPFATDDRRQRPLTKKANDKKSGAAFKGRHQPFDVKKVPERLDAVVVGSDVSSLTTAAILAKTGRTVLVLEPSVDDDGTNSSSLDPGMHTVGQMGQTASLSKVLLDQITDGQMEWTPMEDAHATVFIHGRKYSVMSDLNAWKTYLLDTFPQERKAINAYFSLLAKAPNRRRYARNYLLKFLPAWVSKLTVPFVGLFLGDSCGQREYALDVVKDLTSDKHLQLLLTHNWLQAATVPSKLSFGAHAATVNHYKDGAFRISNGGSNLASEFARQVAPVIERTGGKVMVNAKVTEILHNGFKAMGVALDDQGRGGGEVHHIVAPLVVSGGGGVRETFQKLLPQKVAQSSSLWKLCQTLKPAVRRVGLTLKLNGTCRDLGLKVNQNTWALTSLDDEKKTDQPVFITCTDGCFDKTAELNVITCLPFSDKEENSTSPTKLREKATEQQQLETLLVRTCHELFPQIRNKVQSVEASSIVRETSSSFFDQSPRRFEAGNEVVLRPETDVPGLYLTGADVLAGPGFCSAMFAGLLTAAAILERNILWDLHELKKTVIKQEASPSQKQQ